MRHICVQIDLLHHNKYHRFVNSALESFYLSLNMGGSVAAAVAAVVGVLKHEVFYALRTRSCLCSTDQLLPQIST